MKKLTALITSIILLSCGYLYSQGKWITYNDELDAGFQSSGNYTANFIEDKAGNLILTSSKGKIIRYNGQDWRAYEYMMKIKAPFVNWTSPVLDNNTGFVWFGANTGIVLWDGINPFLMTGSVDSNKRMVYGDENQKGFAVDNNKMISISGDEQITEQLPAHNIYSVLVDSKNRTWFGNVAGRLFIRNEKGTWTEGNDVYKADIKKMVKKDHKRINKLFEDRDHNIGDSSSVSIETELESPMSVFQDSEGSIWIGYVSGVARFDGNSWKKWGKDDEIEDVRVPGRILEDKDGNIWFCAKTIFALRKGGGLYKFDGSKWESVKVDRKGFYSDILKTRNDNLYCTTMTGFYQYKNNAWEMIRKIEGFATFYHEMFEDSRGDIWFGTSTLRGYVERYTP